MSSDCSVSVTRHTVVSGERGEWYFGQEYDQGGSALEETEQQ